MKQSNKKNAMNLQRGNTILFAHCVTIYMEYQRESLND